MSDDVFGRCGGENNFDVERSREVGRDPRVTNDLDTVFGLLHVARRRFVLYYLYEMDGRIAEFEGVVDAVRTYESADAEPGDCPSRAQIRTDLHHAQLPTLEDAEVVEYDRRQGTVRLSGHPSLEEWLEHARHLELD